MKVFITRPIPTIAIDMLKKAGHTVSMHRENEELSRKDLCKKVKGAHAILSLLTTHIDASVMDAAGPQLKVIANYAIGYDNIDCVAAKARNILVTNTPAPEIADAVADHTIALMLALSRKIVAADAFVRSGSYTIWDPNIFIGTDLSTVTVGLIGLGRIGKCVARHLVRGFDAKILYTDVVRDRSFEKEFGARFMTKDAILENADIVSLHVPLLPQTRHLINAAALRKMKKGALLINTARGPIVDQLALLRALQSGKIGGAALDVFECEPLFGCSIADTKAYQKLSNVIFTPHIGSATLRARTSMARLAAEAINAVFKGKKPSCIVS